MKRGRAALLSLAIAASAVAGLSAVRHSAALGTAAQRTPSAQIARRSAQLDRYQASLVTALAKRPPPLPQVPVSAAGVQTAAPVRVLYQRAPSIVVSRGDEHEGEQGQESDDD